MTLYQNCSNRSTPLNKMAARAKNRKTFKRLSPEPEDGFEIIIQECFLDEPLPKYDFATLNKMATRAINRNKFLTTSTAKPVCRF